MLFDCFKYPYIEGWMMKKNMLTLAVFLACTALAQETFPVNDVQDNRTDAEAFVNVTLHVDYQTVLTKATLLIKKGRVIGAGKQLDVPDTFVIHDLKGKHIYPSFIDPYTGYGLPKPPARTRRSFTSKEQIEPATKGAYGSNDAIKTQYRANQHFKANDKHAASWRKHGFGAVLSYMRDGIARGSGTLVALSDEGENRNILKPRASTHYSFKRGSSKQSYPSSTMGAIALLRQTQLDALWFEAHAEKPFTDNSLEAFLEDKDLPRILEGTNWKDVLRASTLGSEFGQRYIAMAGGDAYRRLEAIKAVDMDLIVPINFPKAINVSDPLESHQVSLAQMKHWELAPSNPAKLAEAGIAFALTAHGLKKKAHFRKNLRKAIKAGLSEEAALKATTHTPARLLRVANRLGSLKQGYIANFLITDAPLFEKGSQILENWVLGKRYVIHNAETFSPLGSYHLTIRNEQERTLFIKGGADKYKASFKKEAPEAKEAKDKKGKRPSFVIEGELVNLTFEDDKGAFRLSGWRQGLDFVGRAVLPDGSTTDWSAIYQGKNKKKKPDEDDPSETGTVIYPFLAFGWAEKPQQETLLIKNATVWSNEAGGILTGTDVLVKAGKIAKVAKGIRKGKARVIDGTGKHLTPGIIDEHSHIALKSINEVATNSGMVRMSDVVDSDDVNIYRNLAGGVTAAQLLHGSANPIGGQSALIKMRWGASPQQMLIEGADRFIKFALGENVKRSFNSRSIRYPQTRMGVEQVYMDAFSAARDYQHAHRAWTSLPKSEQAKQPQPRKDLKLEAMVEILEAQRYITCHSYVQSEINMLMHVADRFEFRVNTFTHILEGYKVADKMAARGTSASTFADWWAYKWEVRYAIPYNPSLMQQAGVVVAINSDSVEMGRRLNQEAAKSVKYGGMSEEDAFKMVTLNPAKILHLDKRLGSIKKGKDADLVLWSDHPLSIYARVETTLVDGIVYYSQEINAERLAYQKTERTRLINKLQKADSPTEPHRTKRKPEGHCNMIGDIATGDE